MKRKIKIVYKEPNARPQVREIEDELEVLQNLVGGLIEYVEAPFEEDVDLIVNEEGHLLSLEPNIYDKEHELYLIGSIIVAGVNKNTGETISLSDSQIENTIKWFEGKDVHTCCICGWSYVGHGHNAEPVKEGRCCEVCNGKYVVPARLEEFVKSLDE